jgi:hypothetical protein
VDRSVQIPDQHIADIRAFERPPARDHAKRDTASDQRSVR